MFGDGVGGLDLEGSRRSIEGVLFDLQTAIAGASHIFSDIKQIIFSHEHLNSDSYDISSSNKCQKSLSMRLPCLRNKHDGTATSIPSHGYQDGMADGRIFL
jgi:hypothetical protein